jgi:hypothetical protein
MRIFGRLLTSRSGQAWVPPTVLPGILAWLQPSAATDDAMTLMTYDEGGKNGAGKIPGEIVEGRAALQFTIARAK